MYTIIVKWDRVWVHFFGLSFQPSFNTDFPWSILFHLVTEQLLSICSIQKAVEWQHPCLSLLSLRCFLLGQVMLRNRNTIQMDYSLLPSHLFPGAGNKMFQHRITRYKKVLHISLLKERDLQDMLMFMVTIWQRRIEFVTFLHSFSHGTIYFTISPRISILSNVFWKRLHGAYLVLLCPHFILTNANCPLEMLPPAGDCPLEAREEILIQQILIIQDVNMQDLIAVNGSNFYTDGCPYICKHHLGFSKKN